MWPDKTRPDGDTDREWLAPAKSTTVPSIILTGRPNRDTVISEDDITNLVIALNTFTTFKAFLKLV
jgi:hypothetical protein